MRSKNTLVLFFCFAFLTGLTPVVQAAYDDYTAFPPFLSSSVPPNILLVLDRSGSMSYNAYSGGFVSGTTYEGYFVPNVVYEYDSGGYWKESSSAAVACPSSYSDIDTSDTYSGSCLNYYYMDRIDLLRWALTGGRPAACSGTYNDQDCDPDLATDATCSGTTCRLETYGSKQVEVPKTRLKGVLQEFEYKAHRPRFGVMFYGSKVLDDAVYLGDYYNGNNADATHPYTYSKRLINAMTTNGDTPTGPAMEEAYDYFKQSNDHTQGGGGWFHHSPDPPPFELASTPDNTHFRDPINICEYDKSSCSSAPCMKNFVILVSDGEWNDGDDPVEPAYQMHTEVLRTLNSVDVQVESVFTLGLFLGGNGERALKNVAMYGSFDTTGRTWPGGTSDYPNTSLTTDIPSPSYSDWDDNSDGEPDTFFSAQDAGEIKTNLNKYIYEVLKKSAAGSAVSILAERRVSGMTVHQALFFPSKYFNTTYKVDWTGVLNSYWYYNAHGVTNIREDNTNAFVLDQLADHPIDFVIDSTGSLSIDYYQTEANGGTDYTTGAIGSYTEVDDVHKIWEGGDKLRQRSGSDRTIFGVNESGTMEAFTAANVGDFDALFGDTANMNGCLDSTGADTDTAIAMHLMRYVRGEEDDFSAASGGCRTRVVNAAGDIWKLGDTINSTPWVVDYETASSSQSSAGKHAVLYMGANDGMLHAFHVGELTTDSLGTNEVVKLCDKETGSCTQNEIGKELWAFIPQNSMPYLRYLADPDYQHMYVIDMSPYLIEDNGKKILIGGMRMGGATGCSAKQGANWYWCGDTNTDGTVDLDSDGDAKNQIIPPGDVDVGGGTCSASTPEKCGGLSSYFALDITDPYDPKFLWEFTHKDLGFTYSGPAFIKRTTSSGTINRYIMFLSGPLNYKGFAGGQDTQAFIIKVDGSFQKTGDDFVLPLVTGKDSYGSRLFSYGIDANLDGNTDLVAFGVNWRSGVNWQGNVYAIGPNDDDPCTNSGCSSVNWEVTKAFNSDLAPITGKVVYNQCFGEPFIYFNTGRWLYKNDSPGSGSNPNALYGVKLGTCLDHLTDADPATTCADGLNINSAHSSSDMCSHLADAKASWMIDGLEDAAGEYMEERSISDPTGSNFNAVFFTTTQPSSNVCSYGGVTRVWGVNCLNGDAMTSGCPSYGGDPPNTAVLLQLSGGNIERMQLDSAFTQEGGRATVAQVGIPPESGATIPPATGATGEIILWIER